MLESFLENILKSNVKFAILKLNKEGYGRSAHNWSSHQRVGSLSRIGSIAENKGTIQKNY